MTTKRSSLSFFAFFASYTYAFLGAHNRSPAAASIERRNTRSRAATNALYYRPSTSLAPLASQSLPPTRSRQRSLTPSPYIPRGWQRRQAPTLGTAKLAGKGSAAPARGTGRSAPGAQRQPRARGARRQRDGDLAGQRAQTRRHGRGVRVASAAATAVGNRRTDTAAEVRGGTARGAHVHSRAAPTSRQELSALRMASTE